MYIPEKNINIIIQKTKMNQDIHSWLLEVLSEHSISSIGVDGLQHEPSVFQAFVDDKLAGVCVVRLFWGSLHIKGLGVGKDFRKTGVGYTLMKKALDHGKEKNCKFAFLETMSFQAPLFYQKLGFKTEFIREGYEKGTSLYYLKKDF